MRYLLKNMEGAEYVENKPATTMDKKLNGAPLLEPEHSVDPASLTILILEMPYQMDKKGLYFTHRLAQEWEKMGHSVLFHYGVEGCPPADILVLHVDVSVVPEEYLAVARRYPVVLNGEICDIRKRAYSVNRVTCGDGYEGPVIVKSNSNSAGLAERYAALGDSSSRWKRLRMRCALRLAHHLQRLLPLRRRIILYKSDYRIFPKRAEVPAGWVKMDGIIIERFRPELHEGKYVLREWYFFGDRSWMQCETSNNPIFTSGEISNHLSLPPPPEIRRVRERQKMDFGKIDYAIDADGNPVLYDINKTAGMSAPNSELIATIAARVAPGLESLVRST